MVRWIAAFLAAGWLQGALPAAACGADTDCAIGARSYRIAMPENADGPVGALIFAHGYRGTSNGVMRNQGLRRLANELGVALIAADSRDGMWDLRGHPVASNEADTRELSYFDALLADATARFDLDPARFVMTGFSSGGMVVWTLACHRSGSFAGFIPISGTFWEPVPPTCPGPVASIVHIHGDADRTVPLGGRQIEGAHQGDVPTALAMYAGMGGFGPALARTAGSLSCQNRTNPEGALLGFCLFSGGHSFRLEHVRLGWDMLRVAGRL